MVALLIIIIHNDYYNACSAHKSLHQSQYHGPMNWKQMNNKLVYEVEVTDAAYQSLFGMRTSLLELCYTKNR